MELSVALTIGARESAIERWLAGDPPAGATRGFDHHPSLGDLGSGFERNPVTMVSEYIAHPIDGVSVVLKSDGDGGYVIQSAFPVPSGPGDETTSVAGGNPLLHTSSRTRPAVAE